MVGVFQLGAFVGYALRAYQAPRSGADWYARGAYPTVVRGALPSSGELTLTTFSRREKDFDGSRWERASS